MQGSTHERNIGQIEPKNIDTGKAKMVLWRIWLHHCIMALHQKFFKRQRVFLQVYDQYMEEE